MKKPLQLQALAAGLARIRNQQLGYIASALKQATELDRELMGLLPRCAPDAKRLIEQACEAQTDKLAEALADYLEATGGFIPKPKVSKPKTENAKQ